MLTLKERIALKQQATNNQEPTQNFQPPQSTPDALENKVDTNIRDLNKNAPLPLKSGLLTVSSPAKLTFAEKLALSRAKSLATKEETNATLVEKATPQPQESAPIKSAVESIKTVIQSEGKKLSLAEKIALKKNTQEAIEYQMAETHGNINAPILTSDNSAMAIPDADFVEPIKNKIAMSLLDRINAKKALEHKASELTVNEEGHVDAPVYTDSHTFALDILLNEEQLAAVELVKGGKSGVVLGAAGTGKTTSERSMMHAILSSPTIGTTSFKVEGDSRIDAPSVAVVAYTRRAASNSAKAILKDPVLKAQLPHNIMTIHALLEFIPETYQDAEGKERFRFAPTRNADNRLNITHLIIEEATLVGLDLWEQLIDALPYDIQVIFVGDINQLPPVFGPSILNYALTRLPVIELVKVYRQAEGSPIINNAHRILKGEMIEPSANEMGKLTVIEGKNPTYVGQAKTLSALSKMFEIFYSMNIYNPESDMILSPWNVKDLGTDSLNKMIAEMLSLKYNTVVYELLAGFSKLYLGINDKVMFNKRDCIIVDIQANPAYLGATPHLPGTDLSRWGFRRIGQGNSMDLEELSDDEMAMDIDYSNFDAETAAEEMAERKMQCSHIVTLAFEDGYTQEIRAVGDFSPQVFQLGYAMTVHKAQGSEWNKVFIIFHKEHVVSLNRELLYTAITRAREEVYLFAKQYLLNDTVKRQKVKGNTLKDKIEFFNSGIEQQADIRFIKTV